MQSVWAPTSPILAAVQTAGIFNDSKDFVDAPLLVDPETCWTRWNALPQPIPKSMLQRFVDETFGKPESLLTPWTPPDFVEEPPMLSRLVEGGHMQAWAKELNAMWLKLGRKVPTDLARDRTTLLPAAHGFVVPGGRFREAYYWDSYWIVLGLLAVGMRDTAGSLIENLLDAVRVYGFVPNGLRSYYLNRSQPPMLTQMVCALVDYDMERDATSPEAVTSLLEKALPLLDAEYEWWMRGGADGSAIAPAASCVQPRAGVAQAEAGEEAGGDHTGLLLNRYVVAATAPRVESYREDSETAAAVPAGVARDQIYSELAAAAESGWDFSTRWLAGYWLRTAADGCGAQAGGEGAACAAGTAGAAGAVVGAADDRGEGVDDLDGKVSMSGTSSKVAASSNGLASIRTSEVAPVELNAILYRNERTLQRLHGLLAAEDGRDAQKATEYHDALAERYGRAAQARKRAMDRWMWNSASGRWHDLEWASGRQLAGESAASYTPLWAGAHESVQAEVAVVTLSASKLFMPGGVATTCFESGEQWDAPNAWPPLQQMLVEGLQRCGAPGGVALSETLARRWLRSNWLGWKKTGHMHEKYDAGNPGERGGGGEYTPQVGFGWTNGVVLWLLEQAALREGGAEALETAVCSES